MTYQVTSNAITMVIDASSHASAVAKYKAAHPSSSMLHIICINRDRLMSGLAVLAKHPID